MPSTTVLVVAVLAVWRLTHLLVEEAGPGDVFVRLRRWAEGRPLGGALHCFYCLSLWISAPMAVLLGDGWIARGALWLGLSGGAILLQRATSRDPDAVAPALWHEELPAEAAPEGAGKGETDGVLRPGAQP
jgi:hypothetical protein